MITRKDLWILGAFVLIAALAALSCYVLMDLARPQGVAIVAEPAISVPATPMVLSGTAMGPAPVPKFGSIVFGLGTDG